jgi:hypothetical protein
MIQQPQENFSLYDKLRLYPDLIIDEAINNVRPYLRVLLKRINHPEEGDNIGLVLESLICILFKSPYLQFNRPRRNCAAGEIDLDFTVKKFPTTLFAEFDYLMIIECKNWGKKPGAPDLRVFRDKAREADAKVSIFVSKQGITREESINVP